MGSLRPLIIVDFARPNPYLTLMSGVDDNSSAGEFDDLSDESRCIADVQHTFDRLLWDHSSVVRVAISAINTGATPFGAISAGDRQSKKIAD